MAQHPTGHVVPDGIIRAYLTYILPHHLTWARAPERYQMLINGLRREVTEKVVDDDKSYARATAIQNRVLKSLAGLTAMNQKEAQALATK